MKKLISLLGFMITIQAQASNIDKVHCSEIFYTGNKIIDVDVKDNSFVLVQQSYRDGRPVYDTLAEGQLGTIEFDDIHNTFQIELLEGAQPVGTLIVRDKMNTQHMSRLSLLDNKHEIDMHCSVSKSNN